jgi:hypothetical protein
MAITPESSLGVRATATRALTRFLVALFALAFATVIACAQSQTPPNPVPTPPAPAPGLEPASSPTNAETPSTTPTTTVTRAPSPSEELNTLLMHATFLISGPTKVQGQFSFGTVFMMGVPYKENPKIAHIVLVTAAHVLEGIAGDNAALQLRRRNADGTYAAFSHQLPIRKSEQPLYVRHKTADVAAMYADLPDEVPMTGLPPDALVTDKTLEDIEIHPGDDAFVLGFPLAVSAPGGFPIVRVGHIASYPLTPMRVAKQWEFDLKLFGGNSGGPVYFSYVNRPIKNQLRFGVVQGILGLVIQEQHSIFPQFADKELSYGVVVPAQFIRETIEMLPAPPDEATGSIK